MTYADRVKRELLKADIKEKEVFLELLKQNKTNSKGEILLYSPKITKTAISCLKDLNLKYELLNLNLKRFKKERTFNLEIKDAIPEKELKDEAEYLRLAFLLLGSVNDPKSKTYHLEFQTKDTQTALKIQEILTKSDINAKITKRRNNLVIYVKKRDEIADILLKIGSREEYFYFLDTEIKKELTGNIKKSIAFSIANQQKTNKAAKEFSEVVLKLKDKEKYLTETQRRIIELKEANQEASLQELSEKYTETYNEKMTKSKLQHQINKIKEMATELV